VAEKVAIRGNEAKIRRPWGAFFLALITLGIYYLVWYYKTNRELREISGIDVSPGVAVLAISLGGLLIIPPFVSQWRFYKRIRQAQETAGLDHPVSHITGFVLFLVATVLLPFEIPYAQHHLNRLWMHEREEESKRAAGMRGTPASG
jgi:formate hydrogenlyase subunit 3/multisubunit Na+/H+ antiporter MnhD subunit